MGVQDVAAALLLAVVLFVLALVAVVPGRGAVPRVRRARTSSEEPGPALAEGGPPLEAGAPPTGRGHLLLVVVLVAAALAAWIGLRGLAARTALEDARADLATARSALGERDVVAARTALAAATERTGDARSLVGDPVWRAAAALPLLGDPLARVRLLTRTVDEVATSVLPAALDAVEPLAGEGLRRQDGSVDLPALSQARPLVEAAAVRLDTLLRGLGGRSSLVPGPVRRAEDELAAQLAELSTALGSARQALDLAPAVLGADRPRSYFVMVQQPGESRGTGGLLGGYAVVRADSGRISVTASGSNQELEQGEIPLPEGVPEEFRYEYGGNRGLELWQNVNLSPDLPVVARVVAARWRAQTGEVVDGVIALDPTALGLLFQGSGPVDVGGGRQVSPEQLVQYLTVDQYAGLAIDDQATRKDALGEALEVAARRLTSGGGDGQALVGGLLEAVRSGHLRFASDHPGLRDGLREAGIDGALPPGPAPVAYPVVLNATEGKLDSFLDRAVTYTAEPCSGPTRRSTIAVDLTNRAPARGLPDYLRIRITEEGERVLSNDSAVLLQVYGTADAQLVAAELDGRRVTSDTGPDGVRLYAGLEAGLPFWNLEVSLPREQTRRVVLQLEEPSVPGEARVPEQPLVRPLHRTVAVPACEVAQPPER